MNLHSAFKLILLTGSLILTTQAFSYGNGASNGSTPQPARTAETPQDDAAITNSLKSIINKSPLLSKQNIQVTTTKGVVSLEGEVESNTQVSSLVEHAESIVGVADVDTSKLTVKGSQDVLTDTITTAKVKGLLIREKLFGEKDVAAINTSVETKDGVVYLSGVMDNKEQINNAIEVIKRNIPEVKKVEYSVSEIKPAN